MLTFTDALKETTGLAFPVGESENNKLICADLLDTPHLLVAGATGTGKSVFVHSLVLSLAHHNSPDKLRFILCDTKMAEFGDYNGIGHLLIPVITDTHKMLGAIQWTAIETMKRLRMMSEIGKKDIRSYNDSAWENFWDEMPRIMLILDDFSTILSQSPEVADPLMHILMNGRTVGIHIVAVTQTPTWKTSKKISALFRSKVIFSASSGAESRFLLGKTGAETLALCGDALFSNNGATPIKVHSIMANSKESSAVLDHAKSQPAQYDEMAIYEIEQDAVEKENWSGGVDSSAPEEADDTFDELLPAAIEVVVETGMASVSMLQRRLKLGYSRCARLVDQMEEKGVVGPFEGSRPRQVLITKDQWKEMQYKQRQIDIEPIEKNVTKIPSMPQPLEVDSYEISERIITFIRKKQFIAHADILSLSIDDKFIGDLKSGSMIVAHVSLMAKHKIVFTDSFNQEYIFEIEPNPDENVLSFTINFDLLGKLWLNSEQQ